MSKHKLVGESHTVVQRTPAESKLFTRNNWVIPFARGWYKRGATCGRVVYCTDFAIDAIHQVEAVALPSRIYGIITELPHTCDVSRKMLLSINTSSMQLLFSKFFLQLRMLVMSLHVINVALHAYFMPVQQILLPMAMNY